MAALSTAMYGIGDLGRDEIDTPQGSVEANIPIDKEIEKEQNVGVAKAVKNTHGSDGTYHGNNTGVVTDKISRHECMSTKDKSAKTTGDAEASESERARIECLGRERPAKFNSFGAEVAFCYSIIASQFMAVRVPSFSMCYSCALMTWSRNISCPVSM